MVNVIVMIKCIDKKTSISEKQTLTLIKRKLKKLKTFFIN